MTSEIYHENIEKETLKNKDYRRAVYTVPGSIQLVYMSLPVDSEIPTETHAETSQFIRVESGKGLVIIEYSPENIKKYKIEDGSAVIIPYGLKHTVKNTGKIPLKLYTLYTPPEHPFDAIEN